MADTKYERFLSIYTFFIVPFLGLFTGTGLSTLRTGLPEFDSWQKQNFYFHRRFQAGSGSQVAVPEGY
jgi:hypothetical protein